MRICVHQKRLAVLFILALTSTLCFRIMHAFLDRNAGTAGLILLTVAELGLAVILAVLFFSEAGKARRNDDAIHHHLGALVLTMGQLLEKFLHYFNGSFMILHTVFGNNGGNGGDAENLLGALLGQQTLRDYLETKNREAAEALVAGRDAQLSAIDELLAHAEHIIGMLDKARGYLPTDAVERLKAYHRNIRCNEVLHNVVVAYDFYSEFIHEFVSAIIVDLSRSSRPLSEEILAIKENTNRFVANVSSWEQDLNDEQSEKNFSQLLSLYHRQNEEFTELFKSVEANYTRLEKRLDRVMALVDDIDKLSLRVQSIAENINVLSINASIESARAGEAGRGFKVVADEVKGLSEQTNRIIGDMTGTMNEVRQETKATVKEFVREGSRLSQGIRGQQQEFEKFYTVLDAYGHNFEGIFESVNRLIEEIDAHIKRFNPLFQLHEVSVQEMENLNKIIDEFLENERGEMNTLIEGFTSQSRRNDLVGLIKDFEKKTISRFELAVLEKIVKRYRLGDAITIAQNRRDVEIF